MPTDNQDWKNKILNDLATQSNSVTRSKSTNEAQNKKGGKLLNTQFVDTNVLDDQSLVVL